MILFMMWQRRVLTWLSPFIYMVWLLVLASFVRLRTGVVGWLRTRVVGWLVGRWRVGWGHGWVVEDMGGSGDWLGKRGFGWLRKGGWLKKAGCFLFEVRGWDDWVGWVKGEGWLSSEREGWLSSILKLVLVGAFVLWCWKLKCVCLVYIRSVWKFLDWWLLPNVQALLCFLFGYKLSASVSVTAYILPCILYVGMDVKQ